MTRRPAGAAALRLEAAEVLRVASLGEISGRHLSPPRVVPFAVVSAAVVGLTGTGVVPGPVEIGLDLGISACYLLSLRAAIPRLAGPVAAPRRWLADMDPAILAVASVLGAAIILATGPGTPWTVITPLWLLLMLSVAPWLDAGSERGELPRWGPTALACLLVTVPVPYLVVGLSPGLPGPVQAATIAVGCLVPSWRMIRLAGTATTAAWGRAVALAVIIAAAAAVVVRVQVPGPLLPVALLVGWYGLTGIAGLRNRADLPSFAAFVVLAATILAISAPA